MELGCNMFTYNLNRRYHYRRHRMYMNNSIPKTINQNQNRQHIYNNLKLNTSSRIPAALGRSMYSKPKDGGCGCGK